MNVQNFKSESYCVGGRHRSAIKNICGVMTSICSKVLFGYCSIYNRNYSMTGCDNTKHAVGLGQFFRTLCEKDITYQKKMAKNVLTNPGRALEIGANVGSAFASGIPKSNFVIITRRYQFLSYWPWNIFAGFVKLMLYKWNKNVKDYTHQKQLKLKILIWNKDIKKR